MVCGVTCIFFLPCSIGRVIIFGLPYTILYFFCSRFVPIFSFKRFYGFRFSDIAWIYIISYFLFGCFRKGLITLPHTCFNFFWGCSVTFVFKCFFSFVVGNLTRIYIVFYFLFSFTRKRFCFFRSRGITLIFKYILGFPN